MRFEVFGRELIVERGGGGWRAFHPGEGKRRPAHEISIPPDVREHELEGYLADLLHELATATHPGVRRLD